MSRTQITLENEVQRRAPASELGVSLAEYVRRLVARDLARPETAVAVDRIFDLGSSGGADIAMHQDSMIAEAFQAKRKRRSAGNFPLLCPNHDPVFPAIDPRFIDGPQQVGPQVQ